MFSLFYFIFLGGRGGGHYFCGSLWKSQKSYKLEPAKISCHTVSLVYLNVFCFVDSLFLYLRKTIKKIVPFVGEKLQRIWNFFLIAWVLGTFWKLILSKKNQCVLVSWMPHGRSSRYHSFKQKQRFFHSFNPHSTMARSHTKGDRDFLEPISFSF